MHMNRAGGKGVPLLDSCVWTIKTKNRKYYTSPIESNVIICEGVNAIIHKE